MLQLSNGRLLFLADIHLDNYPNYNFRGKDSRLNQYLDFAKDIDQICDANNIGTLILGGDTLNKGVNDPDVEHVAKDFLRIVSKSGARQVLHILGQHDIKRKEQVLDIKSSFLNLFPEYTTYVGQGTIIEYNGYKLAFRDWVPSNEADTFWSDDELMDFFFAHVTNNPPFGQKIKNNKFKIGLFGDIHQQTQYENMINLGTPFFHHRLDEEQDGRYAIIDLNKGVPAPECIEFHKIDPTGMKYLKVKISDTELPEGKEFDNATNTFYMFIPPFTVEKSQEVTSEFSGKEISNEEIRSLIDETFKNSELAKIHGEVIANLTDDQKPIDLNFQVVSISIQNFRSIKQYQYTFGRTTAILGDHGSGKSTFINAIKLAMTLGKIDPEDISSGEDYAEINLLIKYHDVLYTLCATSGTAAFAINGEWQNVPARQRLPLAKSHLPFLDYLDVFIFTAEDSTLLSAINDDRKSEIISKFYNIDILNELHDKAVELSYAKKQLLNTVLARKTELETLKTHLSSQIPAEYLNKSLSDLDAMIHESELDLGSASQIQKDLNEYRVQKSIQARLQDEYDKLKLIVDAAEKKIHEESEIYENYKNELAVAQDIMTQLNSYFAQKSALESQYSNLMTTHANIESLTKEWRIKLDKVSTSCPTCGAPIEESKIAEIKAQINAEYQGRYQSLTTTYNNQLAAYQEVSSKFLVVDDIESKRLATQQRIDTANQWIRNYENECVTNFTQSSQLKELKMKLDSIHLEEVEARISAWKVNIDADYSALVAEKSAKLENLKRARRDAASLINSLGELQEKTEQVNALTIEQELYERYTNEVSNTSKLYQSILQIIAAKFSNEQYKLTVGSYMYRGKMRISIQMSYLVGKYWYKYPKLSSAQKCFCDIYFLSNILKNSGVLILDEYFKNVNSAAMIGVMETLKTLNITNLILSSHHDGLVVDGDILRFELVGNESNITKL